jgi:type VI secretion system secreted protein Hcp
MAMMAYMYAKGQKSGQIKGSITQKGREDSVGIIAMSHEIEMPINLVSGMPSGGRLHKPFVVEKELDKSSPILYNCLCTNENLTEVTIKFWTPQIKAASGVGAEVQHYTVTLKNVHISSIQSRMDNVKNPELVKYMQYETIAFTYHQISWVWNDGGITAQDDWEARA